MKTQPPCSGRRRFDSKQQATAASMSIYHRTTVNRPAEPCRHCFGWHLGSESK